MKNILFLGIGCLGLLACSAEGPFNFAEYSAIPEYNRSEWKHWIDADGDCQDTRQEVLIRDSQILVDFKDARQCQVATGLWVCPYTGKTLTDPGLIDIDHRVALSDAHFSGGWSWTSLEKESYANKLMHPDYLVATSQFGNRSKGNKSPASWLPPLEGARCAFIVKWEQVKNDADLLIGIEDQAVIAYMKKICNDGTIPPLPQR